MANFNTINNAFSKRIIAQWTATPIAWDNAIYNPSEGTEFIRCTNLPSTSINHEIGVSKINYGIYWIQIFIPKNSGTGRAYELADMLDAIFSNTQFDEITCYASDVQRTGDEGHNWFQLNFRINYYSHERIL